MISATNQQTYSPVTPAYHHGKEATTSAQSAQEQDSLQSQSTELSEEDQQRVRELKARDREVRAHEQAHLSAAGGIAKGGANYTFERGPDQQMYAVGGEVQIDTSAVADNPVATLRKAQIIRRAALAPANPSSQDRSVAAEATQMASQAQADIAAKRSEEEAGETSNETDAEVSKNTTKTATSCAACGDAHSSAAHDGMSAYAATQSLPSDTPRVTA